MPSLPRLIPAQPAAWHRQLLLALGCLLLASLIRAVAAPILADRVPFITFFPAVLIAAIWGGWLGGSAVLALTPVLVAFVLPALMHGYRLDIGSLAAFVVAGGLMVAVGAMLAASVRREISAQAEQREAEAQLRGLIAELGHRAKNGLGIVMAIAEQSSRQATSVEDYKARLMARLTAMSASQDLVTRSGSGVVKLGELLSHVLDPFDLDRFEISNAAHTLNLSQDTALGLSLVFHELATNATKYGALSVPAGRVAILCGTGDASAEATWRERDGPPVAEPRASGFGTRMFTMALRRIGGETQLSFKPEGAECRIRFRTLGEPA